ncbi:PKD domain-containing protein [bacterium]|nr:PKD domain-containing protein [bacterium]
MLGGCAGQGAPESAGTQSTAYAEELAALNSLTAPEGVSAALWGELTAELARVLEERTASAPPAGAASATILGYDEASAALSWGYYSSGDYDQNGEVGISDLTPLGIHFGKTAGEGEGGSFDPASIEAVVDGDANGEINISDVTPIGVNFGVVVEGYRIYRSDDIADYPGGAGAPNGPGSELVAEIALAAATGGPDERKQFVHILANPLAGGYYWVRPYHGAVEGTPSNYVPELGANTAPLAVLRAEPDEGFTPLTVQFDASLSGDVDGEIVKYEWEWDGLLGGVQWVDGGASPLSTHTYTAAGNYAAYVRVTDDGGASSLAFAAIQVGEFNFVYAIATDRTIRVIEVDDLIECDTQVDPRLVHDITSAAQFACYEVGAITTPPRRRRTRVRSNMR